ncbi:MAG: isoleucine--tRNA ligase [Bacillota bacterium]|jgi:isoleucyl-tRNA synthetase|nr:isoleucine--tRNA ligase [Candidatus Fermentithermobacillaceae bacterium]
MALFKRVDPKRSVNQIEEAVLDYWKDNDIFLKSISNREGKPKFVFYEGPPTANGRPGIHHVLARTLKDVVCRYKTMQGCQVPRKAGWDTHGLPVEIEVERQLGLSSKQEIEEYGIEAFNQKCRESVFAYEKEWRLLTERIAYWVDMDDPYVTLHNDYIETVWWILKQFFDRGLIYEGHKVLPYCPRCGTPLASHEVAQGYKDEQVTSIYVKLKVKDKPNEYLLIWTTTPWTLPSNVSVTVNPESTYVKVLHEDELYYVAKERVEALFGEEARVLEEFPGKQMEYMEYEQLFPFVTPESKAFIVTCADYVSTDDGTGLVHTAPAYGEDDHHVCREYGLPMVHLVDETGRFVQEVTDWAGMFVRDADREIIRRLRREGKLFRSEQMVHSYPHCWRCDTPLLYYARKSWYIETTKKKDDLIANNKKVQWFPEHVGTGRFGNWLENLVDWSLSRNRYWGTPLNIWRCEQCDRLEAIGSRKELAVRATEPVDIEALDLHRPYVDRIHLRCQCGGQMARTPEVIDCWFDSGSMPYGQWHYPFENQDKFKQHFPADFICEGLDQTRGWFYSLLAISTLLFGEPAFKQVLVNDLILDKHGQKMSKSRGNAVDPWMIIDKYGSDTLRWYLLAVSPPWVPTRFDEDGIRETASRFFGTLVNVYAFFTLYANIDEIDPAGIDIPVEQRPEIDRWVISRLNSLLEQIGRDMEGFELSRVARGIESFLVDEVSNWYVRRSRERFWSNEFDLDKKSAYRTLYEVLIALSKAMAPFAPFLAEDIYRNLTRGSAMESVHLEDYPEADRALIDPALEERMGLVITLVSLGRAVRNKMQIKVRQPLRKMMVNEKHQDILRDMEDLVKEELNVKQIEYVGSLTDYVDYEVRANLPVAGPKYGKDLRGIIAALGQLDAKEAVAALSREGALTVTVDGRELTLSREDIDIRMSAREGFAVEVQNDAFVVLDTEIDQELAFEGHARELVSKVQTMRKNAGFDVLDHIAMVISSDEEILEAVRRHMDYIQTETLCDRLELTSGPVQGEEWDINGRNAIIKLERL